MSEDTETQCDWVSCPRPQLSEICARHHTSSQRLFWKKELSSVLLEWAHRGFSDSDNSWVGWGPCVGVFCGQ